MSTGITIDVKDQKADIDGYFQNLAAEFDDFATFLKRDGCDIAPYLYCPESYQSEEAIREWYRFDEDATEEVIENAIAYIKLITTDSHYPVHDVYLSLVAARKIAEGYGDDRFNHGKQPLLEELDELIGELEKKQGDEIEIQLLRC